jgi:hypothetical protein
VIPRTNDRKSSDLFFGIGRDTIIAHHYTRKVRERRRVIAKRQVGHFFIPRVTKSIMFLRIAYDSALQIVEHN